MMTRRSGSLVVLLALGLGLGQLALVTSALAASTTPSITETWSVTLNDAGGPVAESSPNVANLPGGPAVVVGDRSGNVYALNLANGATVSGWPFSTGGVPVDSTPSVWSATPGGLDSVFIGVGNAAAPSSGGYEAISPQGSSEWFTQIASSPAHTADAGVQASMAVGQLQGTTAVVAGSLSQEEDALNATTGSVLSGFPWFEADSSFSSPALADLYGNGQNEIIEGGDSTAGAAYGTTYQNGGHLRILGDTGNAGTGTPNGGLICQYNTNQTVQSSPAVGNFLPGGATGIVFGTSSYYAGASDTDDVLAVDSQCELAWSTKLDGSTSSSPALADIVGNGGDQVVEGTNNGGGGGSVWVLDAANGQPIWHASTSGEVIGSVVTADLAGQGYQDPIVPTTSGVEIFDGRSGQLVATLGTGYGFQNSPLVTLDPNGTIGITIAGYNGSNEGVVLHYEAQDTNQAGVYEPGAWPMFRDDPQLTGVASNPAPAAVAGPNLIADSSFSQSLGPWSVASGQNWAVYQSSSAPVGSQYLETNSGSASAPSVYQDVAFDASPGHSYQASVFLRSPSAQPVSVALVVWALGGSSTESAETQFTVSSSSWTRHYAELDVAGPGHTDLRFQVYLGTSSVNLDLDGAVVQDTGVADADFDQSGLGPWNVSSGQNWAVYPSSSAPVGSQYLETNSGSASAPSVYQDVASDASPGHSYQASVFLRSPSAQPVNVALVVWALGGSAAEVGESDFTVSSSSWTSYSTDLDVENLGHTDLRFQLYLGTSGVDLDLDGEMLQDAGLADAAFDQSSLGPWNVSSGANWEVASGSTGPFGSGQDWLQTNTGSGSSSSFYQDIATDPVVGHSYTASVYLTSLTGGPISVAVVVWAVGGSSAQEAGQTLVTVGSTWQQYTTVLDVTNPGYSELILQVYVGTSGQTLGAAMASLPDVEVDPG